MSKLSDRIKSKRKELGISQQDLAFAINVSKSMINRYENKDVQPPADVINNMAEALQTSVDYLINGTSSQKAEASLKNVELLQAFKEVDNMPKNEMSMLLHYIQAYLRDYKTRQAYA